MKAAIIGLGVGEKHLETLNKISFIKKILINDLNINKTKKISKKYKKAIVCDKLSEIYSDKDVKIVCIASYDSSHFKQIINALKNDKHVFVEKPALIKINEAKIINNILKKKKLFFGSNYILRKSKRFIQLKKLITQKYFGQIYSIEGDYNYGRLHKITKGWRSLEKNYSITLSGGIHIIDLIIYLMGKLPKQVYSEKNKIVTHNTRFKQADYVTSILKFEDECILKITSNFGCVYPHFHKLNIYGTKKSFENFDEFGKIYFKRDVKKFKKLKTAYKSYSKGDLLKDFTYSIKNNINREKYKNDVFNSLSVCFAIEDSLKTNKNIKIKYI